MFLPPTWSPPLGSCGGMGISRRCRDPLWSTRTSLAKDRENSKKFCLQFHTHPKHFVASTLVSLPLSVAGIGRTLVPGRAPAVKFSEQKNLKCAKIWETSLALQVVNRCAARRFPPLLPLHGFVNWKGNFFLPDFPAKKFITSGCAECPVLYSCDALVLVVREDAADGDRHVLHHSPPPLVRRICQGVSKYELKKAFFN